MVNIVTNFYSIVFIVGLLAVLGYFILYAFLYRFNKINYKGSIHKGVGYGYRDLNDPKKYI